jgi:deoxyhypusine synthase
MNVAALALDGNKCVIDPNLDVNETASIVLDAKRGSGKKGKGEAKGRSAVFICGGGSPKNFMLQTEPQIQEVLGIDEKGHDFFLQITDARPDTGGLSGATPAEAVSWGKIDPDRLPDAVVCYLDSTVALPLLTSYAHARHAGPQAAVRSAAGDARAPNERVSAIRPLAGGGGRRGGSAAHAQVNGVELFSRATHHA